jgi:hypothetical protein
LEGGGGSVSVSAIREERDSAQLSTIGCTRRNAVFDFLEDSSPSPGSFYKLLPGIALFG